MRIGVAAVRTRPMSKRFVTKDSGLGRQISMAGTGFRGDAREGASIQEGRTGTSERALPQPDPALERLDRLVGRSSMEGHFVGSDRPNPGADETVSDAEQEPEAELFARMGGAP
jgi:hypothetical protein